MLSALSTKDLTRCARLSKAERHSRYRQCGHDISELLEWIDGNDPKLGELESVRLLRRVFVEQFEVVQGTIEARRTRLLTVSSLDTVTWMHRLGEVLRFHLFAPLLQ